MELPSKTQVKRYFERNQSEWTLGGLYVVGTGLLSAVLYKLYKTYPDPTGTDPGPVMIPMDNGTWLLHLINGQWLTFQPNPETTEE